MTLPLPFLHSLYLLSQRGTMAPLGSLGGASLQRVDSCSDPEAQQGCTESRLKAGG